MCHTFCVSNFHQGTMHIMLAGTSAPMAAANDKDFDYEASQTLLDKNAMPAVPRSSPMKQQSPASAQLSQSNGKAQPSSHSGDVVAWLLNVVSSVLIVFVNKVLMDPKKGYGFVFATTLCSLHFFTSAITARVLVWMGVDRPGSMPLQDTLIFAATAGTSIAALNLSLLVNTVGFYQIAKLLIIPFVCLVEAFWLRRTFSRDQLLAIAVVVVGVGIVTVNDVSGGILSPLGLLIAAVSVVASGMQQILCGLYQRKHGITANQMLSSTAPVQGVMLLIVGPFMDQLVTGSWVLDYSMTTPALWCLILSCGVAALVNLSQFMCLGRFHAVTFQVLGHTKTILVLLAGVVFLGDIITGRKLLGMLLAVAGMAWYGYLSSLPQAPKA